MLAERWSENYWVDGEITMSIPKVIHYCWFGGKPLPLSAQKCVRSWEKYCSDYQFMLWNEENFPVNCNVYCAQMFAEKRWAFLSDYARLKIIYEHGGIYLDTDVQLLKPLDDLLGMPFLGMETTRQVATGLGFGAPAGQPFLKENMAYYERLTAPVQPRACPLITTELLAAYGLDVSSDQIQMVDGFAVYPPEYFCPKDERSGLLHKTKHTYSIHHFDASWFEASWKAGQEKRWKEARMDYIRHIPNRAAMKLLGNSRYQTLKQKLKSEKDR